MQVRCPRCSTVIEKPAVGNPVCPNCGFGAPPGSRPLAPPAAPVGPPWSPTPPVAVGSPKASGKSVAAMVLGIVACCIWVVPYAGFFVGIVCAILAIVLAVLGMREAKANPQQVGGKGMAITGLVLGIVYLSVGILVLLIVGAALFAGFSALGDYCDENPDDSLCEESVVAEPPARLLDSAPAARERDPSPSLPRETLLLPGRAHAS